MKPSLDQKTGPFGSDPFDDGEWVIRSRALLELLNRCSDHPVRLTNHRPGDKRKDLTTNRLRNRKNKRDTPI